MSLVTNNTLHQ